MDSLSRNFEAVVDGAVANLESHPRAARVLNGTATAAELASYYATAFVAVRQATHFLSKSRDAVRAAGGNAELVALLSAKCDEERGHHDWLAEDMRDIGLPLGAPGTPQPGVAGYLYNTFHDALVPHCGEAFLGTAFVLESLSVRCAGRAADNLRAQGRIAGLAPGSTTGVRFLASHFEADVDHVAEMAEALPRLVQGARARRHMELAARFTATIYPDFFD